jgi:Putative zinc-finger
MEHQEAIETYAAEGYLLDELTDAEREDFEQHFADCESCFDDVRDGVRFIHALPEAVKEEEKQEPHRFRWAEMATAASIAVALTAGAGYVAVLKPMRAQMARTRAELAEQRKPRLAPLYVITDSRTEIPIIENGRAPFILEFPIPPAPPDHPSPQYTVAIVDARGVTRYHDSVSVSAERAKKPFDLPMPGGALGPGDYSLIISGAGGVPESPIEFTVR